MLHEVATLQSPTGECRLLWYIWNNEGAFEVEKIPVENPLYNCANSAQKALAVWFSNDQIGIRSVNQRKLGENDDSEYHEYLELHQGALQSKPKDLADVVAYKHPAKQSCIISSIWPTGLWEHP